MFEFILIASVAGSFSLLFRGSNDKKAPAEVPHKKTWEKTPLELEAQRKRTNKHNSINFLAAVPLFTLSLSFLGGYIQAREICGGNWDCVLGPQLVESSQDFAGHYGRAIIFPYEPTKILKGGWLVLYQVGMLITYCQIMIALWSVIILASIAVDDLDHRTEKPLGK